MKRGLIMAAFFIVAVGCSACQQNNGEKKETTTVESVQGFNYTHEISYVSDGDAVKDSSVLGENVHVFSPEDNISDVQKTVSDIYKMQEMNQFGDERHAILFKPGTYDSSLEVNIGYYTQVAGLGVAPTDTNIQKLWVNADWMRHNATCNFWRSGENFSVNEYCMWANSQAVSLRRMHFGDGIVLSDGEGWSSGGFIADSYFKGTVSSGSQQQYLFRNNDWRYFENGVWNMVFLGVNPNKITRGEWPYMPYTKIETTPTQMEKPYMVYDEEYGYGVMMADSIKDSQGVSWKEGVKGTFYSLNTFYIANPETDNADTINKALESGKNLLLTPGIYHIEDTIKVTKENTIVYGMGLATIVNESGCIAMEVADVDGVKVCGILFEAGETEAETLLMVGNEKTDVSHKENPMLFSDVYFRVGGGSYAGKVKSCVVVNSNDVIGDNFWVWRGDHSHNVGWEINTAPNGAIINGDNVTFYGLFVEHFQEYQTIWNGDNGKLFFYQSEIPYDAPSQEEFVSHDGKVNGYASIKISDDVNTFESYGIGVYCYNRDADIEIFSGVEAPDKEGVVLNNTVTVKLNGNGQITHVINDEGREVIRGGNTSRIIKYENGLVE